MRDDLLDARRFVGCETIYLMRDDLLDVAPENRRTPIPVYAAARYGTGKQAGANPGVWMLYLFARKHREKQANRIPV